MLVLPGRDSSSTCLIVGGSMSVNRAGSAFHSAFSRRREGGAMLESIEFEAESLAVVRNEAKNSLCQSGEEKRIQVAVLCGVRSPENERPKRGSR